MNRAKSERMRQLWADPAWRERQKAILAAAADRRWLEYRAAVASQRPVPCREKMPFAGHSTVADWLDA